MGFASDLVLVPMVVADSPTEARARRNLGKLGGGGGFRVFGSGFLGSSS